MCHPAIHFPTPLGFLQRGECPLQAKLTETRLFEFAYAALRAEK